MLHNRRVPEPHLSREALRILSLSAEEKKTDRDAEHRPDRALRPGAKEKLVKRLWM